MQSINKMPSFGDNTLSACIQAEMKNMDNIYNGSDMEKYFKDNMSGSKLMNNSNSIDKKSHPELNSALCNSMNIKSTLNQNNSKCEESKTRNALKFRANSKANTSSRSKIRSTTCVTRNCSSSKVGKEDVNINYLKSDISSETNTLLKQCNKSELSTLHTNSNSIKISGSSRTTNNTNNLILSNSRGTINIGDKSSIIVPSVSIFNTQDRCKLASWGLPPNILQKYEARGITNMFPWQVECLSNHKVIEEQCNLVYSAPTSAGKTLVAEILMIKTILERHKKAIFILPFVSVVREKMYYFQDLLSDSGIRVQGFMGGIAPPGGFSATHVAIATIEKANSLINRLMEENEIVNLGAVVIDELHLVGDPHRGYLLELLLTKLKYMTVRDENINIQLIGMSATLPNLSLLASWLNAELYKTEFRPVPLNEQCKIGKNIYDNKLHLIRTLISMPELTTDSGDIIHLCIETISDGHSVLIFCPTKNWCEKLAEQIAVAFYKLGRGDTKLAEILRHQLDSTLISETLEQLKRSPIGLDNVLNNTVSFGTAFHHAGLTMDERDIIEGAFRSGSLRVLVATSTLSSGVNLPARRVIIRSPMFNGKLLDSLTYRQMIGRSGRMGKDTAGESILICEPSEQKAAEVLLSASLQPIKSCLDDSGPLIRALLEAIASEVVYTPSDLELYTKCTLISLDNEHDSKDPSNEAIQFLIDNEFLLLQNTEEGHRWIATAFGKACLAASIPPREGLFLLEELQKARRCFVLDTELHVVYLVTPISSGNQIGTIDWMTFMELWKMLSESERRVGQLVGVEERFLTSAIQGIVRPGKSLNIHRRFYTALALHDLVHEVPLSTVCKKYGCCRGILQSLQQSASAFAGMVTQFCKQLGWDCMELLVSQFQARLQFGVCRELLDLLRLPMLNGLRARSLYKQGITCVADLAVANELDIERALYKALPFESEKEHDGEHESEAMKRNKMRTVFVTGRDGLTPHEAAIMLVHEARALVANELKLQDMSWKQTEQCITGSESHTETNLQQNTFHTTTNTNIHTKAEISACNNSEININSSDKLFKEKNEQNSCSIITKNFGPINEENEILKVLGKIETFEADINISNKVENTKEFNNKCNLENDVLQENKNHSTKPTDQLLQLDIPEMFNSSNGKLSFDFFEESSPKIPHDILQKRSSESLISFKDNKKNHTQNITVKHSIEAIQKSQNKSEVPCKKIRTSDKTNTTTPVCVNIMTHMLSFEKDVKSSPISRSPSLFDDSLNLDTQICNVLEQNIVDSLHFSEFEETKSFEHKVVTESKVSTDLHITSNGNNKIQTDKDGSALNFPSPKNNTFFWKDDSWNESKKIIEKVNEVNVQNKEDRSVKHNARSIKNTNLKSIVKPGVINSAPEIKKKYNKKLKNLKDSDDLMKISQKRRFKDIAVAKSPMANVVVFSKSRGGSLDSNKSDSDDIIVASQNINSPATSIKIRSKLDSERKQKLCTQKTTNNTPISIKKTHTTAVSKTLQIEKRNIIQKLSEIFTKKVLTSKDCSTDSVISNSDEDTPAKSMKILQKSQINVKRGQNNPEACLQTNDLVSKMNNWNTLNIVKVGSDRGTFNLFKHEIMQKRYISLALNCEIHIDDENNIGSKIIGFTNPEKKKKSKKVEKYVHDNKKLNGVAIAWESNIAYYISFSNEQDLKIPVKEQIKLLRSILSNTFLYVKCFATKEIFKTLYECCGIFACCRFLDPKVAHWLHDSSVHEKTFNEMVEEYFPQGRFITKRIPACYDTGPGLNIKSSIPGEFRASAEVVLTWHMTDKLLDKLEQVHSTLPRTFKDIEMRIIISLACMELNGLGVSLNSLQDLSSVIRKEMISLEERAYALCGKKFNISSSKEIKKILGLCNGKKVGVNKAVLGRSNHPIASLIMSWRKLNATQTKIIYPILNIAQQSCRIHSNCVTNTLTGRISMCEPNLQNIPKDFISENGSFTISVRMAFVPTVGNVILSADYCQLEFRILAHFSKDKTLCDIMSKPGDIFKNIAANWNHVSEDQVDDTMRQHTKQLCYGMIYGMGIKSLAENLSVDEIKAKEFLESFMNAYPGISTWLNNVVEEARVSGYVTTIFERRRTLPALTSTNGAEKSQAERQAVNTKVQGSAADITKKAMVNIEEKIRSEFPTSVVIMPTVNSIRKLRSNSREAQQSGGFLILQLHDELLYEVNIKDLRQVATIVKESMEQACQLEVPLPVKLKVGSAWGDLCEYNL
ncbi:DNA polymerase theta isoform X1 [Osmia lignaria lignaria]|uniref:DNA polymerase theta isoform X1 n=1 Tax=Osmia lignaria lignaria TaxID=1437193 RepID=UPI00402B11D4